MNADSAFPPPFGLETIRHYLKSMPHAPGVYRMIDEKGNVLYVGKAKDLKNRVSNYVQTGGLSQRIARMVAQTASMEIVTTHTEAEALLLEANLIKRLEPRYNILLRDDKSFPFVHISAHPYPRITKHRGAQTEKGHYFGPFATVSALNEVLTILQKVFLLRPCTDSVFASRSRPCLQYQIKRCSAPCVNYVTERDYDHLVTQAVQFLKGQNREVQEQLVKEMQAASETLDFEKAAALRDRIQALTRIQQEQKIHLQGMGDADVIALHRQGDKSCVQVFFFRSGQNFGNKAYYPNHAQEAENNDILSTFIGLLYQTHEPPKHILISEPVENLHLLEEALALKSGRKVTISLPQRGDKLHAIELAKRNAQQALNRRLAESETERHLLEGVQKLFALPELPKRIEVYDNSHIAGRHALGAMIVAGDGGFNKKAYRLFNMQDGGKEQTTTPTGGDDYAMMRQMLRRRFRHYSKDEMGEMPDLLLIDGGLGHMHAVEELFGELGITIPFVCIAKGVDRNAGREWFHRPNHSPFQLPPQDPVLHYLQRLRDESHRFAIGSHRNKRSKNTLKSELEGINGIGSVRKKALLHHFGSARAVGEASLQEIESVKGINKKTAEIIYNYFHSG